MLILQEPFQFVELKTPSQLFFTVTTASFDYSVVLSKQAYFR